MRSRRRTLLVVAGVAVVALAAGFLAGTQVTSPFDAAARRAPPEASVVTVPVELRTLESEVVTRGDASFSGAVDVTVELGGLETPPVVTGQVPEVGSEVEEGSVLVEIAGRPVIGVVGELPMYRSLRPGMSGPDVKQLEQTLERLGVDPGSVDDRYTAATGRAVAQLFEGVGYAPPPADPGLVAEVEAAEAAVQQAEQEVAAAEQALRAVSKGPSESARVAAENAVNQAKRALAAAMESEDADAIAVAEDQFALAKAQQRELLAAPDTSAERAVLESARERLGEAEKGLEGAQAAAGTPLPAAEVVYVPSLPRQVNEVGVRRGGLVDGPVMSLSGTDMRVRARVDEATRELLAEEMGATLELPNGGQAAGTITAITEVEADGEDAGGFDVVITPDELTAEQREELRSANVRVTIPVSATEGEVLVVPLAALTAGPGGESRVEVLDGEQTHLVEVQIGLSAEGFAEVSPVDGELVEGDLVVVGR